MKRRRFLLDSCLTGAALLSPPFLWSTSARGANELPVKGFNMKFSPEFGIFAAAAGADPLDQIRWGKDQGFRAWENTLLKDRPVPEQEKISRLLQQLDMEFGQFVGTLTFSQVTFAGNDKALRQKVLEDARASVAIARRMNTKIVHNVLGVAHPKLPMDFQMANAIDLLRRIADIYEPYDMVMVMEPMNHKIDHPGMFLHTVGQAYAMAKAVNRPSIKILFDIYHVQIQEGNLLPTLDQAWGEIAYLQMGDTPGRNEPTSGEINFVNVLQHIHDKGYRGFVGLEHGNSRKGKEGALATLRAYRSVDPR